MSTAECVYLGPCLVPALSLLQVTDPTTPQFYVRGDGRVVITQNGFNVVGNSIVDGPFTVCAPPLTHTHTHTCTASPHPPLHAHVRLASLSRSIRVRAQVTGSAVFQSADTANDVLTVESTGTPYSGNVLSVTQPVTATGNYILLQNGATSLFSVRGGP